MERTNNIFDAWYTNTSKMMNDWTAMVTCCNPDKMQQQWIDNYKSMMDSMTSPMFSGIKGFTDNTARDTFLNMLKSADIYTRLYQLWQPVMSKMQNEQFNPQDIWKILDPKEFRSFVDKLFGIDQGLVIQQFFNQYNQMVNFFNSMSSVTQGSANNWYADLFKSSQADFSPYFNQMDAGKMTDIGTIWADLERWGKYLTKINEIQSLLYKTSISAWENTVKKIIEKSADGTPVNDFEEFYNEWSAINEKEYVSLFNTQEYAVLQGEFLELQTAIAKSSQEKMEAFLQPFPIVLKSQLDQLYKTNHELRNRINDLERMFEELQDSLKTKEQ
jgi:hypothetical protein